MTLEEALREAIEYEVKVRDLYANAVSEVTDSSGRNVVRRMAAEEQEHVSYLVGLLREWRETGVVPDRAIPRTVPNPEQLEEHLEGLRARMAGEYQTIAELESDVAMLNRAVDVEKETSDFYQRMVDAMPQQYKGLFRRFLEIEKGHLAIVEAEIDFLHGAGHWFDFAEFSLEIG